MSENLKVVFVFVLSIWISLMCSNSVATEMRIHHIDIVFVIDCSALTNEKLFKKELLLIPNILSKLSIDQDKIRFGLITYSEKATLQIGLGYVKDKKALLHRLWKIEHSNSKISSLQFALKLVRTYIFKGISNSKRYVIIFPNSMWNLPKSTHSEVYRLKEMNVKILMLVIDNDIKRESITEIMDSSRYIYSPHINLNLIQKQYIFNFIVNNIYGDIDSANNTLRSTLRPTATTNLSLLSTQTNIRPATVTQETIRTLPPLCSIGGELVFVIDATDAVTSSEFNIMLKTCISMINTIKNSKVKVDIAIVTFGSSSEINLTFDNYTNNKDWKKLILNIRKQGGPSGLGAALYEIKENIFNNTINYMYPRTILIFSASAHKSGMSPIIVSEVMRQTLAVHFVIVRIGNKSNKIMDDRLSDKPAIAISSFDKLTQSSDSIIKSLCVI